MMVESPIKIRRELDSSTVTDFEALIMGKKMIRHTNRPITTESITTRIMDTKGLKPKRE
jgi:hypothetical protein